MKTRLIECPACDGLGYFPDSECCGCEIVNGICTDCREHCEESQCHECNGIGTLNQIIK